MYQSIFSKIINGEVPCHKIYEDEHTFAFLDIAPVVEGHTLVVHKHQVEFVWDLDEAEYLQLMLTVRKLARHYRHVSGKQHVSIEVIGVDVPHNHIHIKPFDQASELHQPIVSGEPDHARLAVLADRLRLV